MKLYEIAHCRAGDKGNTSILSLVAYRAEDYLTLVEKVTAAAVQRHLSGIVAGKVTRHEVPGLLVLQIVCEEALLTGVTTSLAMDTHGKALSSALLEMEIS